MLFRVEQVVRRALGQDGRREGHPEIAVLDHPVDERHHPRVRRVGEDRAVAERPRAELHAPRAARDHAVRHEELGDLLFYPVVEADLVASLEPALADNGLRILVGHAGTEVGGAEGLHPSRHSAPRAFLEVSEVGRAHRVRLVPAGREGEELLHPVLLADEHVRLDVHEHPAAQGQPRASVPLMHEARPAEKRVFEKALCTTRDRVEAKSQRRPQEERVALPGLEPAEARGRPLVQIEDLAQRGFGSACVLLPGIGRHAHDLVLVLAELHAEGQRHERVEGAERARRRRRGFVARERQRLSRRGGRAEAVSRVVVGQDQRLPAFEARAVVRRGGVAGVVVEADDAVSRGAEVIGDEGEPLGLGDPEFAARGVDQAELRTQLAHLLAEGAARRRPGDAVVLPGIGLVVQYPVEPVARGGAGAREGNDVDLAPEDAAFLEELVDGEARVTGVVLEAGEALFRGAAHDAAVPKDGRRGAVCFVDAEDDHVPGIISGLGAFPQRLDDLAAEGRDIVWLARGDEVAVDDHFLVDPRRAGVHHVVLDREE